MQVDSKTAGNPARQRRSQGWTSVLCALAVAVPVAGAGLFFAATEAQAQGRAAGQQQETRQVQALRESVFNGIARAQEMVEEENYAGAHRERERLQNISGLNEYERAQIGQMTGFTYAQQERYDDAIRVFEQVINLGEAIPQGMRENLLWTLVQLTMSEEQYERTLEYGERWLAMAENPGGDPFYLLAVAHYQLEQYPEAVERVNNALEVSRRASDAEEREDWYGLLRASFFAMEDNDNLRRVLETMVARWPKKDYWVHLASVYGEQDQDNKRLAVMEALYEDGLLDRENEIVTLASLYIAAGGPYKGARVLEKGIEDGIVSETYQNYRLLSQAWLRAQDDQRSLGPLREAAARSDDGQLYLDLAQSHLNLYNYEECVDAAELAISRGGFARTDTANLVLGICLMEQQYYDDAIDAFNLAARDERSRQHANRMIDWIRGEVDYRARIEADLAQF